MTNFIAKGGYSLTKQEQQIHHACIIASRFSEFNVASKKAIEAIGQAKIMAFKDFMTEEESKILNDAIAALNDMVVRTRETAAAAYILNHLKS